MTRLFVCKSDIAFNSVNGRYILMQDPITKFLEAKTVEPWRRIIRERRDRQVTCFQVEPLKQALIAVEQENREKRTMEIDKLRAKKHEAIVSLERFRQALPALDQELSAVHELSTSLSTETSNLSVAFAQITDRLDSATSAVSRATLISQYLRDIVEFNRSDNLDDCLKSLKRTKQFPLEPLDKAAEHVAKLTKIVGITESSAAVENARANLNAYRMRLAYQLANRFTDENLSLSELQKCVQSLVALEHGEEAVNRFISNTKIFGAEGAALYYTDAILDLSEEDMLRNYETLCKFVATEAAVLWPKIEVIFDRTQQVKMKFLQRVFANVLSHFVVGVLQYIKKQHREGYCLMFHSMYQTTLRMCQDIGKLDNTPSDYTNLLEKHFAGQQKTYGHIETDVLEKTLSDKVVERLNAINPKETSKLRRKGDNLNPFREFDPTLCPVMLAEAKDAWDRCVLLSLPQDLADNLRKILTYVMDIAIHQYLSGFIDVCTKYVVQTGVASSVGEFLKLVSMANQAILNLEDMYNTSLKQVLISQSLLHSEFLEKKTKVMDDLENRIKDGLEKCIRVATHAAKKLLSDKQKKSDFLPPESTRGATMESQAARALCGFIREIVAQSSEHLSGENRVCFFTVLGLDILNTITNHYLQFKYNNDGINVLLLDAAEYDEAFKLFGIEAITLRIADFRHIVTSLMLLEPEKLRGAEVPDLQLNDPSSIEYAKKLLKTRKDANEFDVDEFFGEKNKR